MDGIFQAFDHLGFAGELAAQQAADVAVFQAQAVQAFMSDALREQVAHFLYHTLLHAFIDTRIDTAVEHLAGPVDAEQEHTIEWIGDTALV